MKPVIKLFGILALALGLWAVPFQARATHIVGGEFVITHLSGDTYRLQLNLYFDAINGALPALDQNITAYIFSKKMDTEMARHVLPLVPDSVFVPYTNPECTQLLQFTSTRIRTYYKDITLPAGTYSESEGYYVAWQRCCRNFAIANVSAPSENGQTFYTHFPPVKLGAAAFRNSSPVFKPLREYACLGQLYENDFGGVDPDGDSLVYALSAPLAGGSPGNIAPVPDPEPYTKTGWEAGYDSTHQITGPLLFQVDRRTGRIRVRPGQTGLFVISVDCWEYRRGVLIGRTHREFQLLVVDCFYNRPPDINIQTSIPGGFRPGDTITIHERWF